MAENPSLNITEKDRKLLFELLQKHLPETKIWAYGSRINNTNRPTSDLDLIAFVDEKDAAKISNFKEICDESNLTFPIDIHVWSQVPEDFHDIIKKNHILLNS